MLTDLLVRCDAGAGVGLGHLRRCLALAEAFKKERLSRIIFATKTPAVLKVWTGKRFQVEAVRAKNLREEFKVFQALRQKAQPKLTLIDHYGVTPGFLTQLRKAGPGPLLYMDDQAKLRDFPVDGVVNHNVYARALVYASSSGAKKFLGAKYALMNPEIVQARKKVRFRKLLKNVLVHLGGAPKKSWKEKARNVFALLGEGVNVQFVNPAKNDLLKKALAADLVVCAAGVSTYEFLCLGVPLAVVIVADNQVQIAEAVAARNLGVNLGWLNQLSSEKARLCLKLTLSSAVLRHRRVVRGRKLVDGLGPKRLARDLIQAYSL